MKTTYLVALLGCVVTTTIHAFVATTPTYHHTRPSKTRIFHDDLVQEDQTAEEMSFEIDIERALRCIDHPGECSLEEMDFLRSSK